MKEKIRCGISVMVIIGFILIMFHLLCKISNQPSRIQAIGYPKDTISKGGEEFLVIEIHDLKRDTIVYDTMKLNNRMPSTLEDFYPKYRNFRRHGHYQ